MTFWFTVLQGITFRFIGTQLSKIKYLFLFGLLLFFAVKPIVYGADRADRVVLSIPNQSDILLHVFTPSNTPIGVLIALHGCGGLLSTNTKHGDKLSARHASMAEFVTALGWVAVFPDSFNSRGRREICTQKFSERTIKQTHRKADALATAQWVKRQKWGSNEQGAALTRPLKTVLLGWSNGGTTVLQTIEAPKDTNLKNTHQSDSSEPVSALIDHAVAFYPGCSRQLARDYRTNVPLTLFIGGKDDWTPPQPCIDLGLRIGAKVYVYPDAYHGFDTPLGSVRLRKDVPNGAHPGQGVHVGPHSESRIDAYEQLKNLLQKLSVSLR